MNQNVMSRQHPGRRGLGWSVEELEGASQEIIWSEKPPFQLELAECPIQHSEFKIKISTVTSLARVPRPPPDFISHEKDIQHETQQIIRLYLCRNIDPISAVL